MTLDGDARRVDRSAQALDRVALPPRHHARPAGRRRRRAHALDLLHHAGDSPASDIPACHYMIAAFGGSNIRCAPLRALRDRGTRRERADGARGAQRLPARQSRHDRGRANLAKAMWLAVELETIARQYYLCLRSGGPVLLSDEEIAETHAGLLDYGVQAAQGDRVNRRTSARPARSPRHRRRHQRRRHRPRRRRTGLAGPAVREGRPGRGHVVALGQAASMAACATSNITSSAWCARR